MNGDDMKDWWKWCREYKELLIVLLVMDIFTGGFLWLMDARAFAVLFLMFLGISVLLFAAGVGISIRKGKRQQQQLWQVFADIAENQEMSAQDRLVWQQMPSDKRKVYELAYEQIRKLVQQQEGMLQEQREYEDYIETWAHEVKVPLSLVTLLLENRKAEMSASVYEKMNYTNRKMQEYVTQMLYYARLKAVHKDYVMEKTALREVCEDLIEEYTEYADELGIELRNDIGDEVVLTDRKGLHFLLGQILNNACKYRDADKAVSYVEWTVSREPERIWLRVSDNGLGAEEGELPFLFDKGFTGRTVMGQAKATGMGLYLVKQMAKDLSLTLDVESQVGEGFTIRIGFPVIYR